MALPGISTWDATVPHRPGLTDFGGAALQDRADAPPNPLTMPSAGLLNTGSMLLTAIGAVIPNATLSVTFPGGVPTLLTQVNMAGVSPLSVPPTFTILRTPGGAGSGDIFIWWPAAQLPPPTTASKACLNGAAPGMICVDAFTNSGHVGVRIVTLNSAAAATDLPFTVDLM